MNPTSLMFNQMKGISNGVVVAEFAAGAGSSSRLSANMQDDQNSLLDVVSQNTPDSGLARIRDDEVDSNKSGSENNGTLGSAEINQETRKRKKRYNRHTQHQIQEMEAFFRECPHPDDKQRKELARELELEPLQVKFWFQNKRTQVKNQHERSENSILRNDNEKLRAENIRYKEALGTASCPACGGQVSLGEISFDEHNLRLENARLRDEINRMSALAVKYVGKPVISGYSPPHHHQMPMPCLDLGVGSIGMQAGEMEMYGAAAGDLFRSFSGISDVDKPVIIELAVSAMEELLRIAQIESPLWIPAPDNIVTEILNLEEYFLAFPKGVERITDEGLRTEASRENALVPINHFHLVEILMDVNQWSKVFCPIVSRATTVEVLSTGIAGSYNGALQVMTAEFQVPSPLVSTRESLFVRYCKQQDNGTWVVADISLDHHLNPSSSRFRRFPSGCLIQEMPDGFSKVTWVEHVEVDETSVYNIYKETIKCGLAFGAKRWIATLNRQSERLASAMTTQLLPGDVIGVVPSLEGRKAMLKLSERMVMNFGFNVSASTAHSWTTSCGSGNEDVRIMSRKNINDPGRPSGVVLSAVTSFWLPTPPKRTFDFLRDENSRNEWDILSNGGFVQEIAHIANGQDPSNNVSLLRINGPNNSQGNMLILQECCIDDSGCLVVYSPIDVVSMNTVLNGEEDPDFVSLLPSGFAVLPDGPNITTTTTTTEGGIANMGCGGSLLTVSFQILVSSVPTAKVDIRSVTTVSNIINSTVNRIRAALTCSQS